MATKRKFQFSLRLLFVVTTLCAVALAWWFSRPPEVVFTRQHEAPVKNPAVPTAITYLMMHSEVEIRTPRGRRKHWLCLVVIAPTGMQSVPDLWNIYSHEYSPEKGLAVWLVTPEQSDIDEARQSDAAATIAYDPLAETVTCNDTELKCPANSVVVVQYDDDRQPHFSIDDGSFDSVDLPDLLLNELRAQHDDLLTRWER